MEIGESIGRKIEVEKNNNEERNRRWKGVFQLMNTNMLVNIINHFGGTHIKCVPVDVISLLLFSCSNKGRLNTSVVHQEFFSARHSFITIQQWWTKIPFESIFSFFTRFIKHFVPHLTIHWITSNDMSKLLKVYEQSKKKLTLIMLPMKSTFFLLKFLLNVVVNLHTFHPLHIRDWSTLRRKMFVMILYF